MSLCVWGGVCIHVSNVFCGGKSTFLQHRGEALPPYSVGPVSIGSWQNTISFCILKVACATACQFSLVFLRNGIGRWENMNQGAKRCILAQMQPQGCCGTCSRSLNVSGPRFPSWHSVCWASWSQKGSRDLKSPGPPSAFFCNSYLFPEIRKSPYLKPRKSLWQVLALWEKKMCFYSHSTRKSPFFSAG